MAFDPFQPVGQQVMASSKGVVIASNQSPVSVTGTVNVGNFSSQPGSVAAFIQSTNASVITVGSPVANQSVSGTVGASIIGLTPVSVSNFPATQVVAPNNSSLFALQPAGSVMAVSGSFTPAANQSVSGTVQTDVRSSVAVVIIGGSVATATTNSSVMLLNGANTIGSVTALQGTNPWVMTGSVTAIVASNVIVPTSSILVGVTANTNGSVATTSGYAQAVMQITSGPGASITGQINFEGTVDGTQFLPIQGYNVANATISSVASGESNWAFNVAGLQAIRARVSNWSVGSITARVVVTLEDARPVGVFTYPRGTIISSITGNPSISGTVLLGTGAAVIGSVATLQGTNPWIVNFQNSSIFTGWQAPSIVGTYLEDAAHTTADRGLFVMGVRNDTVASLTSNSGDYSPIGVDNAGRILTKPFSDGASSLIGTSSIVSTGNTASVVVFAAPGAGLRNYVTDFNFANTGAAATLVSINDADASVFAKTIAPAGGGSNFQYATPVTGPTANKATTVQIFTASSVVHFTIAGFKAP